MTAATWILMYKKPKDPKASASALKFFAWCYENGDKMAQALDYVADAQQRREGRRGLLEGQHQGRERQPAVRDEVIR